MTGSFDRPDSPLTGRKLASFWGVEEGLEKRLQRYAGITDVASASDYAASGGSLPRDGARVILFEELNAAVVTADPDQLDALGASWDKLSLSTLEDERYIYPATESPFQTQVEADSEGVDYLRGFRHGALRVSPPSADEENAEYLRGFRDGALHASPTPGSGQSTAFIGDPTWPGATDTPTYEGWRAESSGRTWGLEAIGVSPSSPRSDGVRVAVLDSGIDHGHPDFGALELTTASFVSDADAQDSLGHGTHCAGIVAGPQRPSSGPQYGVAPGVHLLAGKVLGADGRGREADLLAAIQWAARSHARVISMSLSAPWQPGDTYSQVFESVAQTLADRDLGTVLVAAAGNDSDRDNGVARAVGRPASSPSVIAVAAVDNRLRVARFSNRGYGPALGQIDIAAPGVKVHSTWPTAGGSYRELNGTSMATPHVAGVLALMIGQQRAASVADLASSLFRHARRLPDACADVGAGLVRAPS